MQLSATKKLVFCAICVALCVVLPMAFHALGSGTVFLPMHVPVLLCGLVCTWPLGVVCGLLGPLLSSVLTGMPAAAVLPSMMAELAVYGLVTALVMRLVHTGRLYGDLYIALSLRHPLRPHRGDGVVKALTFPAGERWSMAAWVSAHILIPWPGTLIQLALLPTLVVALTKARLVPPRY
ncbi:MAG: ECF transporter S component [Dysosmobacter sp.]